MFRLEMEQISQVSSDNDGRRYVQEVMGKVLKCSLIGDLVSLLDVAFQDVVHQCAHVVSVVVYHQQLWETALLQILVESSPAKCLCFRGATFCIHLLHHAELLERERIK